MADDTTSGPAKPDWPRSEDGRPMQFSLPADLVEFLLLGPADDRRVLQDSPLLGDVWAAYALDPGVVQDVLITPHRKATAAGVASIIPKGLEQRKRDLDAEDHPPRREKDRPDHAKIAYLQGLVGARLLFDEVLCVLVPLTQWWRQPQVADRIEKMDPGKLKRLLQRHTGNQAWSTPDTAATPAAATDDNFSSLERYIALAGLIYWVGKLQRPDKFRRPRTAPGMRLPTLPPLPPISPRQAFDLYQPYVDEIVGGMLALYPKVCGNLAELMSADRDDGDDEADAKAEGYIFQISLNRTASAALDRSVPAVKADAAHSLFKVNCKNIIWAVLDSGIDDQHPAFKMLVEPTDPKRGRQFVSRVRKTFDFTNIREIVSNDPDDVDDRDIAQLASVTGVPEPKVRDHLAAIAADAQAKRPINWALVEKLITLKNPSPPSNPHGTHVAGIIGADKTHVAEIIAADSDGEIDHNRKYLDGMCPDIRLYDFRVLGKTLQETEFAVIAALQYIRYVNERHNFITIHGANLSLSILHNVRNFACGRTPVCNECERLIESGVVVVAAAGNRGYQKFETKDGPFENYAAFSITDPGNSDGVITVGSTHGNWPQTYGVSFFSSRGPTGDGRLKPDLVAPGERVQSTVLGHDWAPESGTSMAAPHVSGAAAMLLARYDELVGQPRRVKQILCDSATDLGRERSFQGHGMLDVLRAFQSI
ncbi:MULTISPECIES: S8 family peptidase [Rhodopseudomonas]|uniref:Peptidase S8 n=1 Tax=Rhodopseudomonas palustris TaxID=1076 RepID=A0A0D7EMT6_RHOPL|nr:MULTISPECIES: S8 family peptidase [Rhodopseudomonas]KIZ41860.1 peptidase S8 [Rhodopseudomonas palustris]MDF3811962.1 S8 family peptidase [Rhodopseudomonas sp. BAL398]WOK19995.1 S8 family peptidase [Rhodopseudomonas sp. BAL398]